MSSLRLSDRVPDEDRNDPEDGYEDEDFHVSGWTF